jgi:glycosyltransferase involved in cell wall biosynthesis
VLHDFSLGGTERIAARLSTAWAQAGAEVVLFCGSEAGPLRSFVTDDVRVVAASTPVARGAGSRRLLGRHAAAHFARHPVDLVWVPGNYHWPVIPELGRIDSDYRPIIVAQVSAALRKPQRGLLRQAGYDLRMRHLLRGAEQVVTLAGSAQHEAREILRHGRVSHIPLPALDALAPPPQSIPDGVPIILGAGRLVPEKGFANLITAFARLSDKTARLVIAGDGPERQNLLTLAETLGVASRLSLPGYVRNIRSLLDQARLFVLASDYEGYPAVMIEALQAGRPIVATDCTPATTELLRSKRVGRVVSRGDDIALADAIASMLKAPTPDPAHLSALANPFRIDRIAMQYLDLFDEVCVRAATRDRRPAWRLAWPSRTRIVEAAS